MDIPNTIDQVTADWMANATGLAITSVEHEQIGVGVGVSSAVYRTHLTGDDVPPTVVTKLPALAEEAVFTSTMLRMYIREVKFFEEMAASCPIRVPACHHAAVDEESSRFVIVMEDMGDMRIVDQTVGMELADAERAVDELAGWHAAFWGRSGDLVDSGAAVSLADPVYPAVLPLVFNEGWEKLTTELELDPAILAIGPAWTERMPQILEELCAGPATALHGDYRADNILYADDGSVVLLDFQITGHGSAAYDLAYFVTQSLVPAVAADHERGLYDRWVKGLHAAGVPAADTGELWDMYRQAAYFCLVYPVVASRGMDLADARQRALIEAMNTRYVRAIHDLDLTSIAIG